MTVVVFGSINTDIAFSVPHLPQAGETVLTGAYRGVAGGKGCNQAVAAAKLGAAAGIDVRMVGAVGDDAWAEIPLRAMREADVDTHDVRIVGVPTGLASVMVAADGENAIIVASGANSEVRARQLQDLRADDLLVCQMEVPVEETAAALSMAKKAGARTILNLAPYGSLPGEAWSAVDVCVVNCLEGEAMARGLGLGEFSEPAALARALSARLNLSAIVTCGSEGAVAAEPDGREWQVSVAPVEVVDTTGAGDAFVAGLGVALSRGDPLPEALRLASVAGSLACTGFGAQAGLDNLGRCDAMLEMVVL